MNRTELSTYLELLNAFQLKKISANQFETNYLELFKSDNRLFPENVFEILNKLFSDVDMFVSDEKIRGPNDLDQNQLLECCKDAYKKLENITITHKLKKFSSRFHNRSQNP